MPQLWSNISSKVCEVKGEMRKEAIKIRYPGDCISVNHYLGRRSGGGYYVKQETKDWKEEFQWLLKRLQLEEWQLPLEVTCSGWFRGEGSAPDLSNLSKIVLDSIEEITGINDKNMRWHDGKRNIIGKKEPPYLLITISESSQKPTIMPSKCDSSGIKTKSDTKHRVKKAKA